MHIHFLTVTYFEYLIFLRKSVMRTKWIQPIQRQSYMPPARAVEYLNELIHIIIEELLQFFLHSKIVEKPFIMYDCPTISLIFLIEQISKHLIAQIALAIKGSQGVNFLLQ